MLFSGFGVHAAIKHFKDKAAFEDVYHHAVAERKDMPRINDKEIVLKDNELDTSLKENLEKGYKTGNEKLFKKYTDATQEMFKGGLGFVVEDEGANNRDMRYIALAYFDQLHTFHSTAELAKMIEKSSGMDEGELLFMENVLQQHRNESFFVKNPSTGGIGRVSYGSENIVPLKKHEEWYRTQFVNVVHFLDRAFKQQVRELKGEARENFEKQLGVYCHAELMLQALQVRMAEAMKSSTPKDALEGFKDGWGKTHTGLVAELKEWTASRDEAIKQLYQSLMKKSAVETKRAIGVSTSQDLVRIQDMLLDQIDTEKEKPLGGDCDYYLAWLTQVQSDIVRQQLSLSIVSRSEELAQK